MGCIVCGRLCCAATPRLRSGFSFEGCMEQLHVVDADGRVDVGWQAVVRIAEAIPVARTLAALDRSVVTQGAADRMYRYVAANRHQLSTCRGGACPAVEPAEVRRRAAASPFWICYSLGLL